MKKITMIAANSLVASTILTSYGGISEKNGRYDGADKWGSILNLK